MSEPTPRQVLYGLVTAGFLVVVAILTVGAATAGLVPAWWTIVMSALIVVSGTWIAFNWRSTARVLALAIAVLVVWTVGTLILIP
jgi:hypothetical protein